MNSIFLMISSYLIISIVYGASAYAFNDGITHPKLTEAARIKSTLDSYLLSNTGFSKGANEELNGIDRKGNERRLKIREWLQEGSTDEDALNICRASNHFHDPIRSGDWLTSQMSDSLWVDALCGTTKRYSDITWATGYRSKTDYIGPRTGQYLGWTGLYDAPQEMGWDSARVYFYSALTLSDPAAKEAQFVRTFKSLGQVLHLLQDMAVPAHVRNDMESHLFNDLNPNNWSNPFEKYVVINDSALNIDPSQFKPVFGPSARVTDFWDQDVYTGTNPSDGTAQGLAEYANANFYSGSTIPQNNPSANHRYPYLQISNANYIGA